MSNYDVVVEEIVKRFICNNCQDYLRPPISFCDEGITICGLCSEFEECKNQIIGRCDVLENIGKLLKFPCYYSDHGCKINVSWNDALRHEKKCPFRQFNCPICDKNGRRWSGSIANMRSHIEVHHSEFMINPLLTDFNLDQGDGVRVFSLMNELYVLVYDCDEELDKLLFTVKLIGSFEHATRCYFKITLKYQDSEEYCERKQVEVADDWEINANTAVTINLSVLRIKLQSKEENLIDLKVEVFMRKPLYNEYLDKDFLQDIECLVCQDYMTAPIYQCVVGHSFCEFCKPKLKQCPTCRASIGEIRNFALESICEKMFYKCLYSDDGCVHGSSLNTLLDHENSCQYGLVDCPFKAFLTKCNWRGKLDEVCDHALDEHGIRF